MLDPNHPIAELLERDQRYPFDAYVFVFEALRFAQENLGMGTEYLSEDFGSADDSSIEGSSIDGSSGSDSAGELDPADDIEDFDAELESQLEAAASDDDEPERHVSGQELCEAMRQYAHEQYGYLAKNVLNHWSIYATSDFGEIVFNLIEIEQMRKTPHDRREDFDNVFDFDEGFQHSFQFSPPDSSEERRS